MDAWHHSHQWSWSHNTFENTWWPFILTWLQKPREPLHSLRILLLALNPCNSYLNDHKEFELWLTILNQWSWLKQNNPLYFLLSLHNFHSYDIYTRCDVVTIIYTNFHVPFTVLQLKTSTYGLTMQSCDNHVKLIAMIYHNFTTWHVSILLNVVK